MDMVSIFQTASIVLHYLLRDSNLSFITYWHNRDCQQRNCTDRWARREKIPGEEIPRLIIVVDLIMLAT